MNRLLGQSCWHRWLISTVCILTGWLVIDRPAFQPAQAASPWESLIPFKKIDADPNSSYPITQSSGPWMILAYTFRGDKAPDQAKQLVHELRSKYKLPAYTYERTFDYTKPERGLGLNPDGSPKMMRYQQGGVVKEVAVLVGDYDTVDDPEAQTILKKIKKLQPASIPPDAAIPFADGAKNKQSPMTMAMVVTNPLLPHEFFAGKGVDKLILEMNKDVPNSLLDCPGKFSIQVATFTGAVTIDQKKIQDVGKGHELKSQLEEAAEKAHKMTIALRQKGYEAYEFHDREKSIVCVGSFDSLGAVRPDGTMQLDPTVQKIINVFGDEQAIRDPKAWTNAKSIALEGFKMRVPFDIVPKPIEVPRRSISADYQRSMHNAKLTNDPNVEAAAALMGNH